MNCVVETFFYRSVYHFPSVDSTGLTRIMESSSLENLYLPLLFRPFLSLFFLSNSLHVVLDSFTSLVPYLHSSSFFFLLSFS